MTIADADREEFLARAGERLRRDPPTIDQPRSDPKGDHSHDFANEPEIAPGSAKPAAVLVPVVLRPTEVSLLFTQRATGLRSHAGQISFPGGRIDEGDGSAVEAALREAEEEIGLDRRLVEPLGYLDAYLSSTGYLVTPVVARVSPEFTLTLNPLEVAETFEVPLRFLMDAVNHQVHSREWKGRMRRYYAMPFGDRYIWGVTAGIIRNLYERLYAA
jgi:8-oxo-dGTP pyrophosphatase MutT (NUDIX family)